MQSHDQAAAQREQEHTLRRMGYIYLVLEYLDHDLAGLVDAKVELTGDRLQSIIKQILSALAYMHKEQIVHRYGHGCRLACPLSFLQCFQPCP